MDGRREASFDIISIGRSASLQESARRVAKLVSLAKAKEEERALASAAASRALSTSKDLTAVATLAREKAVEKSAQAFFARFASGGRHGALEIRPSFGN